MYDRDDDGDVYDRDNDGGGRGEYSMEVQSPPSSTVSIAYMRIIHSNIIVIYCYLVVVLFVLFYDLWIFRRKNC